MKRSEMLKHMIDDIEQRLFVLELPGVILALGVNL